MKNVLKFYLASKSLKKLSYIQATKKYTFSTWAEFLFSQKAMMIWHHETFIGKDGKESMPHNIIYACRYFAVSLPVYG